MGQQLGDGSFDFEAQQPPAGVRLYDPNISEVAHHITIVDEEIDKVLHAALQLTHVTKGELARLDRPDNARAFFGITSVPSAPV